LGNRFSHPYTLVAQSLQSRLGKSNFLTAGHKVGGYDILIE